jgi:5-methylcytosine-specific restriction endonuclease McrA
MDEEAALPQPGEIAYPFEVGTRVSFDLDSPCSKFVRGLQCSQTEGYLEIRPYQSTYHLKLSCADGHYVRHVKRAEVELRLGLPLTTSDRKLVRDVLEPDRRIGLFVLLRDNQTCVYCGRRHGTEGFDGKPVATSVDHIVPRALIIVDDIRRDKELLHFARDIQLVTACHSHNSAKMNVLLEFNIARDIFVRHVLKNETHGINLGRVSLFERLYRLAERNARLGLRE